MTGHQEPAPEDSGITTSEQWWRPGGRHRAGTPHNVAVECGWGRLILGQTFAEHEELLAVLAEEAPGRRDICMYVREPHVLVSLAPYELFIDPSVTYRLWLGRRSPGVEDSAAVPGVRIRELADERDAEAINRLYAACGMLTAPTDTLVANQSGEVLRYLLAEDRESGRVLGTVTGVDHTAAFRDPERGSSLWCLAVDPQTPRPGVGELLVQALADRCADAGATYLDLSVMHDNDPAIRLYEKLGFLREPVFCVKRKNPINERLFAASPAEDLARLNPYARIVADEAIRRGIHVEVLDPDWGELRLSHGGRKVITRESLSELTSAVAMSRCDDKRVTRRILDRAGLAVPAARTSGDIEQDRKFLAEIGEVVVKPARGEQGQGITVGVRDEDGLDRALAEARKYCADVLIEELVAGEDLRILVIDHQVVAAAVRRPATITGTGRHSIIDLIRGQSRRRAAATGGESTIPLDEATTEVVAAAGYAMDDVLPAAEHLIVRRTANLHTGGTIHDVTAQLHPELAGAAEHASHALDIPVVGLDFLVPAVDGPVYRVIEANERPGLANHDPQPTAQRFVDLLFPASRPLPAPWDPAQSGKDADHLV